MARRRRDEQVDAVDLEAFNEWHRLLLTRSLPVEGAGLLTVADAPAEWQDRLVDTQLRAMVKWAPSDHWCHAVLDARQAAARRSRS